MEAIDFDTQACVLRVKGRNVQENQYVKVSSHSSSGNKYSGNDKKFGKFFFVVFFT